MSPGRGRRALVATMAAVISAAALAACGSDNDTGEAVTAAADNTAGGNGSEDTATVDSSGGADATSATGAPGATDRPVSTADDYGPGRTTTPDPAVTDPAAEVAVGVGPEGLQLINGAAIAPLAFGTGRDEVVTALEAVLGSSAEAVEFSPECGNQPDEVLRWPGQLRIDIRDDALISWQLERGSPLTTVSGVGLGSTRAEIEDSIVIEVGETSLGTEFTTNPDGVGMAGLLTGPDPTDTVTELWAGEICAFR